MRILKLKVLFLAFSLGHLLSAQAQAEENARKAKVISTVPFLSSHLCPSYSPCFKFTPDSKGILLLEAHKNLIYFDAETAKRTRIASTNSADRDAFEVSPDSKWVFYTRLRNNDEMLLLKKSIAEVLERGNRSREYLVSVLPRFAGQEPLNTSYRLKFCSQANILYVKSTDAKQNSYVHAHDISSENSLKRDLMVDSQAQVGDLKCGPSGIYFKAKVSQDPQALQAELLIHGNAAAFASTSGFRKVLYSQETTAPEALLVDVLADGASVFSAVKSASFDSFPSASIFKVLSGAQETLTTLQRRDLVGLIASNSDYLLYTSESDGNGKLFRSLFAYSFNSQQSLRLTDEDFWLLPSLEFSQDPNNQMMLFQEHSVSEDRWVLSRYGGGQRRVLFNESHTALDRTYYATLSPSGRCVLSTRATELRGGRMSVQLNVIDTEYTEIDIFASEYTPMKMSKVFMAPDSSYGMLLANPDGERRFHLYKIPFPECVSN